MEWLGGFIHHVGSSTSVRAELWVVRSGLEMAWDLGYRQVILEVDSEVVIRSLILWRRDMGWNESISRDIYQLLAQNWRYMTEIIKTI